MSRIGQFIKARPLVSTLIGGAILVAGVSAVSAQYGGGWGGHGGWRGHHGGGGMMGRGARLERMCSMDTARWQPVMRAWVKADLNLTPAQAADFDKLVDVAHPAMEQVKAEACANFGPNAPKVTAPERLEKAAGTMRKAADAMDKAVAPAKAFYATLDEKQKARVEELLERRRGRGMGMGGRGEGRMGGGWGGPGGWRGHMDHGPMGQQGGPGPMQGQGPMGGMPQPRQ